MEQNIMNKEILDNLSIIKKVTFLDFPSSEVCSKQCYESVVSKAFNHEKDFAYLYFDVDKLSILNDILGKKLADRALRNLIAIIKKALPKEAIFSRIGGDEFCIVFPNTSLETALEIETKIHEAIDSLSTFANGLTITSSVVPSSLSSTLEELKQQAEQQCFAEKQLKHAQNSNTAIDFEPNSLTFLGNEGSKEYQTWQELNTIIQHSASDHMRDLRFDKNYIFHQDALKLDAFQIVSTISRFIESGEKPMIQTETSEDTKQSVSSYLELFNSMDAHLILELINTPLLEYTLANRTPEELNHLKDITSNLIEVLIRDAHSGLLAKPYLKFYLADKICHLQTAYTGIYISDVALRTSNTAYGHSYSDMRLIKTVSIIQDVLSKYFEFNEESFSFREGDCYFIDQSGGNYLVLLPAQSVLDSQALALKLMEEINSYADIHKSNSSFLVSVCARPQMNQDDIKTFLEDVRTLKEETNFGKVPLKLQLLSGIDNENALKKTMYDAAQYYMQNIPNPNSIEKKQTFLKNVFTSIVNAQSLHNMQQKKKREEDFDIDL